MKSLKYPLSIIHCLYFSITESMNKLLIGIADKQPTRTVQEFNFVCYLSHGGSNLVYLGYDTKNERPVAIRKVDKNVANNIAIIRSNDKNDEHGCSKPYKIIKQWMIMPLHGYSLMQRVKEVGKLSEKELLSFTMRATHALSWLEKICNFSHGDISPNNFVFDSPNDYPHNFATMRLIDFDTLDHPSTIKKGFTGTIIFASPEHNSGKSFQYRSNDAYALGKVIYFCAMGHTNCFSDTKITYSSTIAKIIDGLTNKDPRKRLSYDSVFTYASEMFLKCD